ncbi:MAG: SRPBCC domain-containing protein [Leptospirales bacterium]|nr:SRPBCC domain-containing protein [Leptospirales bacterium]
MSDKELRPVFKALADESRRRILDIVKVNAGISVGDVAERFDFSRFAVMKHLRILEEANLLKIQKDGRFRKIYLNSVPIQMIYDRWLSKYSRHWAKGLTRLKYQLEDEEKIMNKEVKQVYVMYIRTGIEKLWKALITADITPEWFAGMSVRFEPKVGAPLTYETNAPDGKIMRLVQGKVLEFLPQKSLTYSFSLQVDEKVKADKESRVRYELEDLGETIKLTVTHDQFESETQSYVGTSQGWPMHLSNLKTFIETGKVLALPKMH